MKQDLWGDLEMKPAEIKIDDSVVLDTLLRAVRLAQAERPRIGVTNAHEWAATGRIAMWLARQQEIIDLEQHGIFVDVEYGQMSVAELTTVCGGDRRIDMTIRMRGNDTHNLLALEVKLNDRNPQKVTPNDDLKLKELTREFQFRQGIWIRLPRTDHARHEGWYAVYKGGKMVDLKAVVPESPTSRRRSRPSAEATAGLQ